jgi:hypothetical protein
MIARLKKRFDFTLLRPDAILCQGGSCSVVRDGRPLYYDNHHLSTFGARQLTPLFAPAIEATSD